MIIDLRDYTTTKGNRSKIIKRCESVIFPEQERLGAKFIGIFKDAENPNRFVWLRGMPNLAKRKKSSLAFTQLVKCGSPCDQL